MTQPETIVHLKEIRPSLGWHGFLLLLVDMFLNNIYNIALQFLTSFVLILL